MGTYRHWVTLLAVPLLIVAGLTSSVLAGTASAAVTKPACSTTITGTHPTQLAVTSGVTCLVNATQDGQVTVAPGAGLSVTNSTIDGTVTATNASGITYCGSTEHGTLKVTGTTGPVTLGGLFTDGSSCAADTIPSLVTITGNSGAVTISGLSQNGTLTISGNTGGVDLSGINMSGLVYVQDNTGSAPVEVLDNTINGSLYCTGNAPQPTDNGSVNVVAGVATGQCAALASRVPVPHTAPILANIETTALAYSAGSPAVPVTATLTVSSADATTLSGATVTISSGLVASEDVLGFTSRSGITGSYDASTGVLTLTGTASLADYQAALRSVSYTDTNTAAATATRTISFQVNDGTPAGNLSNVVSRTIDVTAVAAPPVAVGQVATTDKNTAININVLAGDYDPAGRPLHVASVDTTGTTGLVTINANGTIRYDPNGQFAGLTAGELATDSFTYKVSDGVQTSNSATVTVTITGVNDLPVIANVETSPLSYQAKSPAVAVTSTLTVSDADDATMSGATVAIASGFSASADTLSFTNQNGITGSYDASTGVLTLTGSASLADYQAALRSITFASSDASASPAARTVAFTVTDSVGATSATASRTIDVTAAPAQPPAVVNHSYTAVGNTPLAVGTTPAGPAATVSGSLLNGDSDANPTATLSVVGNTTPAHGTVTVNPDGTFTYTPDAGYTGADTFQYTVAGSNAPAVTASATVTITVGTLVWYVDDSQGAAGNGTAGSPFSTLAAAASTAGANSIIFLYQGSATYTGGLTMKPGQSLFGQPHGLTVGGYDLVAAAGSEPKITNSGGNGINLASGTDVEDVTVTGASGNGISGLEVTGDVSLIDDTITGSADNNAIITDSSGTLNLTVKGSTFSSDNPTTGNDGLHVDANGSTDATVSVTGSTFTNNYGDHFQFSTDATSSGTNSVTFSGNTLNTTASGVEGGGVVISPFGNSRTTIAVDTNNIQNSVFSGIVVDENGTSGTLSGSVSGNTIGTPAAGNSGSVGNDIGIFAEGTVTETLSVTGNNLYQYENEAGISFLDREGSPAMNLTITGNTIADPGSFGSWGILGQAGALTGDAGRVCANITGNTIAGSAQAGQGGADVELDQQFDTTIALPGYTLGAADTAAVQTFLQGNNNTGGTPTAIATVSGSGGGFTGGTGC